jgi:hypothetical protein
MGSLEVVADMEVVKYGHVVLVAAAAVVVEQRATSTQVVVYCCTEMERAKVAVGNVVVDVGMDLVVSASCAQLRCPRNIPPLP